MLYDQSYVESKKSYKRQDHREQISGCQICGMEGGRNGGIFFFNLSDLKEKRTPQTK